MADISVSEKHVCVSTVRDSFVVPLDGAGKELILKSDFVSGQYCSNGDKKDNTADGSAGSSGDAAKETTAGHGSASGASGHECEGGGGGASPGHDGGAGTSDGPGEYNYDGYVATVSSAFSPSMLLFASCNHKQLTLWNADSWTVIASKTVQRSVSKIVFSPSSNAILLGDKSGDVYIHYLHDFKEPGTLLMGHVSMLLDILVTKDHKYIITCDRDEKIRVSSFPDAYNIVSYCLGHEECVTSINLLPKDGGILLSSGGDGTFRVWNYVEGKELLCYDVKDSVSTLWKESAPPLIHSVSLLALDSDSTVVCSAIYQTNAVWVYSLKKSEDFSFEFLHFVPTVTEPCQIKGLNSSNVLWVLMVNSDSSEPCLEAFQFCSNRLSIVGGNDYESPRNMVRNHLKNVDLKSIFERKLSALSKKKFDNESEYKKRKLVRIEAENAKKLAKEN